jgi:Ni,Fe-hydrogenase maturation factor
MGDLKPSKDFSSSHGIGIATAFELGQRLGYKMPKFVSIYAVEIKDNTTFGEKCTPEVMEKMPSITKQIIKEEKL